MIAWNILQLLFWCVLFVGFCLIVAVVVLAPPILAGRFLLEHWRHRTT